MQEFKDEMVQLTNRKIELLEEISILLGAVKSKSTKLTYLDVYEGYKDKELLPTSVLRYEYELSPTQVAQIIRDLIEHNLIENVHHGLYKIVRR